MSKINEVAELVEKGKAKLVKELKKDIKDADFVYLATDPDREGEAISWHLYDTLGLKEENLKLLGYTIDEPELASKFDFSYTDSEVVKSLKFGQNGFYAYSKVLSEEKINKLIEIVKDNIDNAFDNILDAKFNINPKRVGKDNIGCSFCKYSDICFMKEEDVVLLDEHNNLDFL